MKKYLAGMTAFVLSVACALTLSPVRAAETIYAQQLTTKIVKAHSDMLDVIFHVTPLNSTQNMAVAAYTAKERGGKSGPDDIGVMTTGKPLVEVQKDGVRIGVLVPLRNRSGQNIGALGLMYAYHKGQDEKQFLRRSEVIRDQLAKSIPSRAALFVKKAS